MEMAMEFITLAVTTDMLMEISTREVITVSGFYDDSDNNLLLHSTMYYAHTCTST